MESVGSVNLDFDRQTVRIGNIILSFDYIHEMKRNLARDFDVQVRLLSEWLEFGKALDFCSMVMANQGVKLVKNKSGRGSVFDVLGAGSVSAGRGGSTVSMWFLSRKFSRKLHRPHLETSIR